MFGVSNYVALIGTNGHPSGDVPTGFNFRVERLTQADQGPLYILGREEGKTMCMAWTGILATKWALEITATKVLYSFKERLLE